MRGIGAVVVAVFTGLTVFTYVATRPPERGLGQADLEWVGGFVEWEQDFVAAVADADAQLATTTSSVLAPRLRRELGECMRAFRKTVGPAPPSLREVAEAAEQACASGERASELLAELGGSGLRAARLEIVDAGRALLRANVRLDRRLLLLRSLPSIEGLSDKSRVEPRLSEAATRVSGIPMSVRCWSAEEWEQVNAELVALIPGSDEEDLYLGGAGVWEGEPNLASTICGPLARFLHGDSAERATQGLVLAFVVLGHEIAHAAGAVDEAETECRGIQLVPELARTLGASRAFADRLAAGAWRFFRSNETLRPEYWSPRCRDGGPWDLRKGGKWP